MGIHSWTPALIFCLKDTKYASLMRITSCQQDLLLNSKRPGQKVIGATIMIFWNHLNYKTYHEKTNFTSFCSSGLFDLFEPVIRLEQAFYFSAAMSQQSKNIISKGQHFYFVNMNLEDFFKLCFLTSSCADVGIRGRKHRFISTSP